jgi:CubicO group peptidase (beta-lactamase class C family)
MLPQVAAKYRIPGLVVALIQKGRVAGIEGFGVRDTKSKAPITENTVFEAGTLSEPIFAYAVLELAAEGRLDLGSPVTQYFPLPYRRDPNPFSLVPASAPIDQVTDVRFEQITGIRALNHTSGLPNWALNDHLRLLYPPGEKWSYSGEAEVYLQRAVEHVTGQPFDALATRTVLGPFGMTHSSYVWRSDYEGSIATGYDANGHPISPSHYAQAIGPLTLYTTAGDYARFISIVLASSVRQRLHEGVVSLMLNPTVKVDDSLSFSWGMGWGLEQSANNLYFFNWSGQPGFYSFVMASRKTGDGVIVFTNSDNGLEASRDIVQAALGGDHPVFKSPPLQRR